MKAGIHRNIPTYKVERVRSGGCGTSEILRTWELSTSVIECSKQKGIQLKTELQPDRPQHSDPIACAVTQQHSCATFVSLRSHSCKGISAPIPQKLLNFFFTFSKLLKAETAFKFGKTLATLSLWFRSYEWLQSYRAYEDTKLRSKEIFQCSVARVDRNSAVGIATRYGPGIEIRWGRDFPHPSRSALEPTHPPVKWVLPLLPEGKATGAWRWPPTPSSADVKEEVGLYFYSPSGPSWPVIGWNLPVTTARRRYNEINVLQVSLFRW